MRYVALAMRWALLSPLLFLACTTGANDKDRDTPDGPNSGESGEGDIEPKIETDIVFADGTTFEKRDCGVTIRWDGGGSDVKIAGEFTDWATSARSMSGGQIKLSPSDSLQAGKLYAYKIVVDGQWKLDPKNRYRKIVDGQMNSALLMPTCNAGPETTAGKLTVNGSDAKVRIKIHSADDGSPAERIKASLDNDGVAKEAFKVDGDSVDFTFTKLPKGKHTLSVRSFDKQGRESEPIDLPFWVEDEPFDYRDGILYMLLIDRFANGEKSNDKPVGSPVDYDADWHGGDLQGALGVLKSGYFEKLGVRTIWLSPLNKQTSNWQIGDGDQKYSGYHGYWPISAREVEPRFGGDKALRAFVAEAHKRGIRVLLDLINNQVHDDHEYVSAHPDWFRKICKCGTDGCGWSEKPFECVFQQYLPDIDWTNYGAEKQFISDAVNWISAFDLDGFRVDAVKHVEANSVYNMRAELTRRFEQGGARIFMVGETAVGEGDQGAFFGEYFANGFDWIDAYTGPNALDGQFDFPTRHNMADGLVNGDKPLDEVENELHKAETRYRPGNHHVRFLNGHDNRRIASIAAKDPKLGCAWSSGCRDDQLPPLAYTAPDVYIKLKRALTVLYTMPGVPYLYQGDEVAFGGGDDPDMRRNMLFGDALAKLEMGKPGSQAPSLIDQQKDLREFVRKLGATRSASRALRRGDRKTLLSEGDLWVYAYQSGAKEVAIVVLNRGPTVTRTINASTLQLGSISSLESALGTGSATKSGSDLSITIGGGEAAIFVP
jgi:glycosidase